MPSWNDARTWYNLIPVRSRLPARTFSFPVAAAAAAGSDDEESAAFARYLLSDDTRMPDHVAFRGPVNVERDDGDDGRKIMTDPKDLSNLGGGGDDAGSEPEPRPPVPAFSGVVRAVEAAVKELQDPQSRLFDDDWGVVVGGVHGTLDDAKWSTMNGTLRCVDVRDVFAVLRCSSRLQRDFVRQQQQQQRTAAEEDGAGSIAFRLTRYIEHHASECFRVFVVRGRVVAVSSRAVDQVFPHLAALDESASRALFRTIRDAVAAFVANLLVTAWLREGIFIRY